MTTEKEIMELLRSGQSIEAIGQEFAERLTRANNAYQAEQRAKVEEENKVVELANVIDQFIEWYEDYYAPPKQPVDAEELARNIIAYIDLIGSIGDAYEDLFAQMEGNKNKTTYTSGDSVDDFLSAVKKYLS